MLNKLIKIMLWSLFGAFLLVTIGYATVRYHNVRCTSLQVVVQDSLRCQFVTEKDVLDLLHKNQKQVLGIKMDSIKLKNLENLIQKIPAVKNVEVYRTIADFGKNNGGRLMIDIEQHEPVMRVMTSKKQYYLNAERGIMPLSRNYSALVPVVSGYVSEKSVKGDLWDLTNYIYCHPFWKSQIEQIYVEKDGDILMVPRVGDHIVELGTAENYETKLRNLKTLYKNEFRKDGWNSYKKISLKYNNQVVCTKK
ncbi:hypothetical protein EMN47_18695 [Prolixibacteraceae bacterium JC049]|nr:hypothetical protein [Prolixibacteraceae bacterium JC049]